MLGEGSRYHQQGRGLGSLKDYRRHRWQTERVCTPKTGYASSLGQEQLYYSSRLEEALLLVEEKRK